MKRIILITIFLFISAITADADWQSTLEANFKVTIDGTQTSLVETFDNLDDWPSTAQRAALSSSSITGQALLPVFSGGPVGSWTYASHFGDLATIKADDTMWITNRGAIYDARGGGKALSINYENGLEGPSRLALFFGDEAQPDLSATGMQDVYIFHMVKTPASIIPTNYDDSDYSYSDIEDYLYKWIKLDTLNMGCPTTGACNASGSMSDTVIGANYSDWRFVPHLTGLTTGSPALRLNIVGNTSYGTMPQAIGSSLTYPNNYVRDSEWWGVEYRFRNVGTGTSFSTFISSWVYDSAGNQTQVMDEIEWTNASPQEVTELFNNFEFGGNNSAGFTYDNGMDSTLYVDDLVIDDEQIGVAYFTLALSGTTVTLPANKTTTETSTSISGTYNLADGTIVASCTGSNDQGGSVTVTATGGTISGTATGLSTGANVITVTLTDSDGGTATDSITITLQVDPPTTGGAVSVLNTGTVTQSLNSGTIWQVGN